MQRHLYSVKKSNKKNIGTVMMMGEFGSGVHEFYDAGEKVFSCLMVLFVRYLLPEGRDWNMW